MSKINHKKGEITMKKTTSKVTAWLLSLLMAVGMLSLSASTAFAANEGTLNIHKLSSVGITAGTGDASKTYWTNPSDGKDYEYLAGATYAVYQIGTMTQTGTSPIATTYTAAAGLQDISGTAITTLTAATDPDSIDVSSLTAVTSGTTTAAGPLTLNTGLDTNGVYLVKETVTPAGVSSATNFIITVPMYDATNGWINTIDAYPKNSDNDTKIDKTTTSTLTPDAGGNGTVSIGDVVGYQVEVTTPSDMTTAGYTKFDIVDTSGKGLLIDTTTGGAPGSVSVDVAGTALTYGTDYTMAYNTSGASSNVLTISFYNGSGTALTTLGNNVKITVTYEAAVTSAAAGSVITNTATVDYTTSTGSGTQTDPGDPSVPDSGGGNTIYTYSYALQKVDESNAALTGADFVLSVYLDASGNMAAKGTAGATLNYLTQTAGAWGYTTNIANAYTVTSAGTNATAAFDGLEYGTFYYVVETAAPSGYVKLADPVQVTIDQNTTDDIYGASPAGYTIQVVNKLQSALVGALPSTGGNGIYLYLIAGVVLIGAASVIYVKTRKKKPAA